MNEDWYTSAGLQQEIARLHEELAKANGACADMACEVRGLLGEVERAERQRDSLQARLEQTEHRLDLANRQLSEAAALQPPKPVVITWDMAATKDLQDMTRQRNEYRGALVEVDYELAQIRVGIPLHMMRSVVSKAQRIVRCALALKV